MLAGAGVGVPGEDLGIAQRRAGVEGIGDGRVAQRVRADVPGHPGGFRDPAHHSVAVAAVDRLARDRAQDQGSVGAFSTARLENAQDRDGQRHGRWLVALADQVQHPVPAERLAVVLDPHRCSFGGSQRVDAEQVGQGAVVHRDGLGDLEEPDQLEPVQALGA